MSSFDVHPVSCNQIYPIEEQTFSCNSTEGLLVTWNIKNLFDICPAQYLDIHINNKNQNYHYFLFEFYSPKLPKSNVSLENILYIETNLFVVSQKSRQHSTRGRQGGDQGRRGDKPTKGLWELTDDIGEWCWWTMSDGKCILITIIIY